MPWSSVRGSRADTAPTLARTHGSRKKMPVGWTARTARRTRWYMGSSRSRSKACMAGVTAARNRP